jgi:essential nuclear protein 1
METLDALMPANAGERRTLADIIFAKLDSVEAGNAAVIQKVKQGEEAICMESGVMFLNTNQTAKNPILPLVLTQKLLKLTPSSCLHNFLLPRIHFPCYRLGLFLHKYKSGPLPKVFKVIPSLPQWARMLALTRPENWSPHACRAATRIFISSMKPPQAQLFLGVVLLDAIREDIQINKKLNPQYYESMKRALYKPGAFFKGLIFPMLDVSPNPILIEWIVAYS